MLLKLMKKQLQYNCDGNDQAVWRLTYAVVGVPFCRAAFMKVIGIENIFNEISDFLICPDSELAIDEGLLPTKARISFLQYQPAKPHKWGILGRIIANKSRRFAQQILFYYGKGLPGRGARDAATTFIRQYPNRLIFTDNLYTGIQLLDACEASGSYLIGTLRKNANFIPEIPADLSQNTNSIFMETERFILELFNARKTNNCLFFNS